MANLVLFYFLMFYFNPNAYLFVTAMGEGRVMIKVRHVSFLRAVFQRGGGELVGAKLQINRR